MQIELEEVYSILLPILTKARENIKMHLKARVRDQQIALIQVIETLLLQLSKNKGASVMDTLQLGMEGIVTVKDIRRRGATGKMDARILELVKEVDQKLEPGQAKPITADKNIGANFTNRVYLLKKEKKIPDYIRPMQNKGTFYLMKEEPETSSRGK